jgi:hypothetical protein
MSMRNCIAGSLSVFTGDDDGGFPKSTGLGKKVAAYARVGAGVT